MSYSQMIIEALAGAPERMLPVYQIYKTISARYPFYKMSDQGWQNSIRHNLSLNKSFISIRGENGEKLGWKLEEGAEEILNKKRSGNVKKQKNKTPKISMKNQPVVSETAVPINYIEIDGITYSSTDGNNFTEGKDKVEKNFKGSLDLIPSPSPSVKIQIMGGKFAWHVKAKHCWVLWVQLGLTHALGMSPFNHLSMHQCKYCTY